MSAICWFRKGLRVHDNPALSRAVAVARESGSAVYPVFILDPAFWKGAAASSGGGGKVGVLRARFLIDSLADLDGSLRAVGSRLYVARGNPAEVLPKLYARWGIRHLSFEVDTEPYAKIRDKDAIAAASAAGVDVSQHHSHTLRDLDQYLSKKGQSAPGTYGAFCKVFDKLPPVPKPEASVEEIPSPDAVKKEGNAGSDEFAVPTLAELGYKPIEPPQVVLYPGGESAALARLARHIARKEWIRKFEKPKTSPNALKPATTVLSPYLKFGCLSARRFYHELSEVQKGTKHTQPPVSLHGQLIWREFFYASGHAIPNFDRMVGNPICRQIPWDEDEKRLLAWREGRTGFPFIDAVMTQLRNEGWIHHLARHAVACFLTRGDLWQSWCKGAEVFEELLLDADWSINHANWMWLSCSAFFHQYFRCYSPVAFGKKTDPEGEYIKKYLPMLRHYPKKYIYEPWTAPLAVQKGAGCIIGVDYPKPIVDHSSASKENMAKMKIAFDASKASKGGSGGNASSGASDSGRPAKKPRNS